MSTDRITPEFEAANARIAKRTAAELPVITKPQPRRLEHRIEWDLAGIEAQCKGCKQPWPCNQAGGAVATARCGTPWSEHPNVNGEPYCEPQSCPAGGVS